MFLYSKKISRFIYEITAHVKRILAEEMGLQVGVNRFYHRRATYPISIVIFNNKNMLGYFDPEFYELGFHVRLMQAAPETVHNVIRHELAHYIAWLEWGPYIAHHGPEYRAQCVRFGWTKEVYAATCCLEQHELLPQEDESAICRKVKKLMALASSANPHEAELALIRSQELLLKHNLDVLSLDDEEPMVLKRIMKQKRESAKMRAIGHILETFFVHTVYNRTQEHTYLEILGSAVNIEIAEYVAGFLDAKLEVLWESVQKEKRVKGITAKNSFFIGLARGYCKKIEAVKQEHANALLVIQNQLVEAKNMAYKRLVKTQRRGQVCPTSSKLGEQIGRSLTINPAVHNKQSGVALLS